VTTGTRRHRSWEEPTLASHDVPPDAWEAGRLPADHVPLTAARSTAAALVADQGCSPQCLISPDTHGRDCHCKCRGHYHGILSDADIATALASHQARR
jgi:hypothetical protein